MKASTRCCRLAVLLALASGCDRHEPPARGGSRDFALEVDALNARNEDLHERSEQLADRLTALAPEVEELRRELGSFSADWARRASVELDAKLAEARERMSELRAVTGFDWPAMIGAAEEAIDELAEAYEEARAQVENASIAH